MERGAKINLPCKSWRCEVPKAVVRPLIEREELCDSQGGAPSAGIAATPPNSGNSLAARRLSTDGRLSAAEGPAQPRGIAAVQQSGGDPALVVASRRPGLTLSRTPTVLKRSGRHRYWRPMSSEEREMSTIARLQRETAEHRRLNEAMMPVAIAGTSQNMTRISIPLTRPINIQFPRNRPAGGHRESGSDPEYKLSHFIKDLRKYPSSTHSTRGCTMPRPFNLSWSRKRECDHATVGQFISMAEYIDVFEHRTQPRGCKRARRQETPDQQGGLRLKEDLENRDQ